MAELVQPGPETGLSHYGSLVQNENVWTTRHYQNWYNSWDGHVPTDVDMYAKTWTCSYLLYICMLYESNVWCACTGCDELILRDELLESVKNLLGMELFTRCLWQITCDIWYNHLKFQALVHICINGGGFSFSVRFVLSLCFILLLLMTWC